MVERGKEICGREKTGKILVNRLLIKLRKDYRNKLYRYVRRVNIR